MMARWAKQSKGLGENFSSDDRISELQDDLLLVLLSHLTFKEAIATSILCRRWRYLWTFTRKLDFDGTNKLLKLRTERTAKEDRLEEERRNCVRWIDHVIASHKGSAIEEFRVIFDLDNAYEKSISEWLRFVLARKVQKLELNVVNNFPWQGVRGEDKCYSFPHRLLFSDSSCDFKYLKKLSLNDVNVNGEALEELLVRKCPQLEHLSVSGSQQLTNLKIFGPFPSFKCLEIRWCLNLNSIEVRDANLVRFTYFGSRIRFIYENVPMLVEMFIGGETTENMGDVLLMLESYFPRLEIFSISSSYYYDDDLGNNTELFHSALKMTKLKHLRVLVGAEEFGDFADYSLMWVANFIRASPCLERFVLEVVRDEQPEIVERELEKIVTPYIHLKEVKFVGYCGNTSDFELVMHVLKNAASLEKLVLDPSQPCKLLPLSYDFVSGRQSAEKIIEEESIARSRAKKQFTNVTLPPGIDFQIL